MGIHCSIWFVMHVAVGRQLLNTTHDRQNSLNDLPGNCQSGSRDGHASMHGMSQYESAPRSSINIDQLFP